MTALNRLGPVLKRQLLLALSLFAFAAVAQTPATPSYAIPGEPRTALLIGNSNYASSPLVNPVNDARAMKKALTDLGFQVSLLENASLKEMSIAVRQFGDKLRTGGGVGVFYYAGHGMQIKGRNYLIPVAAELMREDEVAYTAMEVGALLDKMESARNRINIVILDACRNNPFTRSGRSATQGLVQMDAPIGTYISFATAPGRIASDGFEGSDDANGLFTRHLLGALRLPGLKVEDVFKQVRVKVMQESDGVQVPWDNSSLTGDFYFNPALPAATEEAGVAEAAPATKAVVLASVAPSAPTAQQKERVPVSRGDLEAAAKPVATPAAPKARSVEPTQTLASIARPAPVAPPVAKPVDNTALFDELYRKGQDAAKRGQPAAAVEAFEQAADKGHAPSQYELGLIFKTGRKPVEQDLPRARRLLQKAAEQGNPGALYEAAQMADRGLGGDKNCKDAEKWARKAAEKGSLEAAQLTGELNLKGCDGNKNPAEAARWLRKAADKGSRDAAFSLGVLYFNGDGVAKDTGEARQWLEAAAAKGHPSAKIYIDRLGK
jgi:TPR repeat protein